MQKGVFFEAPKQTEKVSNETMADRTSHDSEADLLFGVFAVQLGFVSAQAVMSCGAAWAIDKSRSIAERLKDTGALDQSKCELLDNMIEQAVVAHGGSHKETLKSIGGDAMVFKSFGGSMVHHGKPPQPDASSYEVSDTMPPVEGATKEDIHLVTSEHEGRYTYGPQDTYHSDDAHEILDRFH